MRSGDLGSAFLFAWQGVAYVARSQRNMRIHLAAATVVLILAVALRVSRLELACLVLCIVLVMVLEMINTVVESVVDLVTEEFHPLAKIAKDVAAGAVLVSSIGAVVVGLLLLGPPLASAIGNRSSVSRTTGHADQPGIRRGGRTGPSPSAGRLAVGITAPNSP
jgi:diacylglycerol kinase (ATP)